MKNLLLLAILFLSITLNAQQAPESFYGEVDKKIGIKFLMAKLNINDKPAKDGLWVCAFDQDGNVVSKEPCLTSNKGSFNLIIYQDDGNDNDNAYGVAVGETFVLKFYDGEKIITITTKAQPWESTGNLAAPQGKVFSATVKEK